MTAPLEGRPAVSVVIPLYNRRATIEATIESVLKQSFRDFEIIVVDDGSLDRPEEVIERIPDPRIRLIRRPNGGGGAARNTGIDEARGRFVAFLDSDDFWQPFHLEQSIGVLRDSRALCTFTQVIVDRGNGVSFLKPRRAPSAGEHISDYLLRHAGFVQTSTLVVPREAAAAVRFDESLRYGQDTDFAIRLSAAGLRLEMLRRPGAIWMDEGARDRVSSRLDAEERMQWLDRIRTQITYKAYWSHMGRTVAKARARQNRWVTALGLYGMALLRGAFGPRAAVVALLQILLRPSSYRRTANLLARLGVSP